MVMAMVDIAVGDTAKPADHESGQPGLLSLNSSRKTTMRHALIALSILLGTATPAMAQVSVDISIPGVSIGINQPVYPELVPIPGYPVYYAPQAQANYFFYDGLYWVYQDDRWYASAWYNGPWDFVEPDDVPLFVLRVPVRYYVAPPVYFHGWVVNAPPRWELYWGPRWTRYHHGWDRWDRRVAYAPAPLPVYQRHYHGDRYPRQEYQRVIRHEHYHYQPRDQVVRERHHERTTPRPQGHAQPVQQNRPAQHSPVQHSADFQREQRPQREREESRRAEPMQVLPQQRAPVVQEQRAQPRPDMERRAQSEPHNRPDVQREQRPQREREETRRSEPLQVVPQQRAPSAQEQRPQPQQERHAEPQNRPDVPRAQPQREPREREESRKPEGMQVLPQQRAAVLQERQQQQQQQQQQQKQHQEAPRAQQAPQPQQAQERGEQGRSERHQPRDNAGRRQGPERGGDRGGRG